MHDTSILLVLTATALGLAPGTIAAQAVAPPNFAEHIAPLVFAHCSSCHRPGQAAPFSLLSFADVRRRGKTIARVVAARDMPPWHPVAGHGSFAGESRLSDEEIASVLAWVEGGMPEGDPAATPPFPTTFRQSRAPPRFSAAPRAAFFAYPTRVATDPTTKNVPRTINPGHPNPAATATPTASPATAPLHDTARAANATIASTAAPAAATSQFGARFTGPMLSRSPREPPARRGPSGTGTLSSFTFLGQVGLVGRGRRTTRRRDAAGPAQVHVVRRGEGSLATTSDDMEDVARLPEASLSRHGNEARGTAESDHGRARKVKDESVPRGNTRGERTIRDLKDESGLGRDIALPNADEAAGRVAAACARLAARARISHEPLLPAVRYTPEQREYLYEAVCCRVAAAVLSAPGVRARRLAEREAIHAVLEERGLIRGTRGGAPSLPSKAEIIP